MILQVLVSGHESTNGGVAFNQSNGHIPSNEVSPWGANGLVSYGGNWSSGTVFVPFTDNSNYQIKYIHNTADNWNNDNGGKSHVTLIGYF
ncbi:hypothetical protein [Roseibacillus ishigakijimensis]|uniref:Uncharacterized protein n=1 Tax=Roseibacillus ishigakijimensis TaxID=454146 RepID=A0A934RUZ2_9BACT|nr:hypothetical protein [Roseibacillus ishigakijimensis]MBK1834951.1 hypothetical protein [Roseibacillus ishigakijimensis]